MTARNAMIDWLKDVGYTWTESTRTLYHTIDRLFEGGIGAFKEASPDVPDHEWAYIEAPFAVTRGRE